MLFRSHVVNDNPDTESHDSGVRPLILHDFLNRHGVDVNSAHGVTHACGDACFMQRFIFKDNWVLVNGVSLTHYPDGLKFDLATERLANTTHGTKLRTFPKQLAIDDDDAERTHFGWNGAREVWKLLDSTVDENGTLWQAYAWRARDGVAKRPSIDSVIVLMWEASGTQEL